MANGQLQTLIMAFLDAVLLLVVAFVPAVINNPQQAAIEGVLLAGVNLGVFLWGYMNHANAIAKLWSQRK